MFIRIKEIKLTFLVEWIVIVVVNIIISVVWFEFVNCICKLSISTKGIKYITRNLIVVYHKCLCQKLDVSHGIYNMPTVDNLPYFVFSVRVGFVFWYCIIINTRAQP